ncbi:hypothetical protein CEUSTIGMA_g5649.t1 [Chlamydomonas eustigma]|uniref:Pirin N-terminal domain-containing protein n=1 Tax=Chlamydomonas eustigma TaxID=1157962 RepID=A0A250X542_9CHLO|nr:hypothetical protein CEUSTIGMA_g5649.t1 [Chlamydomonas eustigma]|eukprot:GAX78207.1 hypothetical protein CEUSTIGMA_g5649.t1 [Chlamydomonas eustigma]
MHCIKNKLTTEGLAHNERRMSRFDFLRVEIHTYSWNGESSHYDTSIKAWVPVKAGGMQVLRTGSGMSHAERVGAGCRGFQIWFDPGPEALKRPATYDVYPPSALQPVRNDQGLHITQYVGGSSPDLIRSEVPGLYIVRYQANEGDVNGVSIKVEKGHSAMLYCLGGNVSLPEALKEAPLAMNDTMALHGGAELYLDLHKGADVFMIKTPLVDQ